MGRNTTGPPHAAPGELRYICAVLQTPTDDDDRRRQTPVTVASLPHTLCVGGPVTRLTPVAYCVYIQRSQIQQATLTSYNFTSNHVPLHADDGFF